LRSLTNTIPRNLPVSSFSSSWTDLGQDIHAVRIIT
jgi:hypothetical protein